MLNWRKRLIIINHRRILLLLILIPMLTGCGTLFESDQGRADAIRVQPAIDPWITAVDEANQLLGAHPDFEDHFSGYLIIAAEINQYLDLVDQARPALGVLDTIKNTDIPFVGNAWDVLIDTLNTAYPGSGEALTLVDSGLHQIIEFKGKLDALDLLIPVANAVEVFRASPSPENLRALDSSIASARGSLSSIDQDLAAQIQTLDGYMESVRTVQEAISLASALSGIPIVGELVNTLNLGLNDIISPIEDFHQSARELQDQIQSDLGVMDSIQEIVFRAENPSPQSGVPFSGESVTAFLSDWAPVLLIGLVALLLLGGFLLWRSRTGSVKPASVQASQAYLPPEPQPIEMQEVLTPPLRVIAPQISPARLEFTSGQRAGQSIYLSRDNLLVGRGSACDIHIPDPTVSRRHALLRFAENVWFIQDQGSTSGTYLNGQLISASRLNSGDQVRIGDTTMIFWVDNP